MVSFPDNPYFSAGFGLAAIGVGFRYTSKLSSFALSFAKKRFLVSLEVTNNDPSFRWVLSLIQSSKGARANHVTVNTMASEDSKKSFILSPSTGSHILRFNGRLFLVERSRESSSINLNTGAPFEFVRFTTLGRDIKILRELLEESRKEASKVQKDKTIVFRSKAYMWEQFGHPKSKRKLSSVILAKGMKESILDDIINFKNSDSWYAEKGVPYRRTYLFHGPPGSGKTSFITAIAGHFNHNLAVVNLGEKMTDDQFAQALNCVPKNSVVLIEDIDAVFNQRPAAADGFVHGVSYSGLLNVLDGVLASEERLVFLTTNNFESLDAALIRPGRVDVVHRFEAATTDQASEMFLKFFQSEKREGKNGENENTQKFSSLAKGRSMAEIQAVLLLGRNSCAEAIEIAKKKWQK